MYLSSDAHRSLWSELADYKDTAAALRKGQQAQSSCEVPTL